jgi:hypothetical protein
MPPPVVPTQPDRGIIWGRWTVVAGQPPKFILSMVKPDNELLALDGNYALLRTPGQDYVAPNNGKMGFELKDSEAFIYADYTPTYRVETPAKLSNGSLTVDFGSKSFATSVDLADGTKTTKLQAGGVVGADGRLYGDAAAGRTGYMNVQGLLSNEKGGSAAYIFNGRLDSLRTVNGVTYWLKH